jgi:DNA-binding NarL/FixJ family response regulator
VTSPDGGVLVGHAHQRLSEGLRHWLQASFEVVYMVGDRASLIDGAGKLQPTLMVLDLALAEGDLAALCAELHGRAPASRLLLLSEYDDAGADAAALSAGVDGVVHTAALAAELSCAVDALLAGGRYVSAAPARPSDAVRRVEPASRSGR